MRELNYNSDSEKIRLDYPYQWNPLSITGLTLTINDRDGTELVAATEASLYSETSLDTECRRYSRSITLVSGSGSLDIGDTIRIKGILGFEDHFVKGWDLDNLTAELENFVDRDFESGSTVHKLSATVTVDLSDTDTFTAGKELLLIWEPTGTGAKLTELGIVSQYQQDDLAGFEGEFRDIYPRAYIGLTQPRNRLKNVMTAAQNEVRSMLLERDPRFDISKIRDQDILNPAIMASCAVHWALNGDDRIKDERAEYKSRLSNEIQRLTVLPVWVDTDDDTVQDDGETVAHPYFFSTGW